MDKTNYVFRPTFQGGCPECRMNGKIYYIKDKISGNNFDYALFVRSDYPKPKVIKCKDAQELLDRVGYIPIFRDRKENPESVIRYLGKFRTSGLREFNGYIVNIWTKEFWKKPIWDEEQITGWGKYNEILDYAKEYLRSLDEPMAEIMPDSWLEALRNAG